MSSSSGPTVPPGQYPPFAVVTPHDHAAWILIATALGLAAFLFFGFIRLLHRIIFPRGFGVDDYTLWTATAVAVIQSSLVLGACSEGLGKDKSLAVSGANSVQKMYYASNLFFIIAVGLSKISVVYFLHRVSQVRRHQVAFNIAIGILGAWIFGSILALALQCDLRSPTIFLGQKCPGVDRRWQVICAFDIISEVAIVGLAAFTLYQLQSPWSTKATVVAVFSVRLLNIVFIAFRLHTFDQDGYTSNPFLLEAPFIAWTQSQMTFSLISATIPTFQAFLKNLNTGFGGIGAVETDYVSGSGSENRSRARKPSGTTYHMSTLRTANRSVAVGEPDEAHDGVHVHALTTNHDGRGRGPVLGRGHGSEVANGENTSIGSDGSQRMMIGS